MVKKTLAVIIAYVLITVVGAIILAPIIWPVGFVIWIIMEMALLFALVSWHSSMTVYTCPNCGATFSVSPIKDLAAPHGPQNGGWAYLRCPRCGKMVKASIGTKKERYP